MQAGNTKQGYGGGSMWTKKITTLSEVDSAWQKGELNTQEARRLALEVCGGNIEVVKALFGDTK